MGGVKNKIRKCINMSGSYLQADILCPFYIKDMSKPPCLKCEGITDKSGMTMIFKNNAEKEKWARKYCMESYKICGLYEIIMRKYDD